MRLSGGPPHGRERRRLRRRRGRSYARARDAISDAPHTEGADEPRWTVETVRDFEEALVLRGRRQRVTVALVTTANDASNAAILAVNRTLGFRPVSTWTDAVLRL